MLSLEDNEYIFDIYSSNGNENKYLRLKLNNLWYYVAVADKQFILLDLMSLFKFGFISMLAIHWHK